MSRRDLLALFLASLAVRLVTAAFISRAGYMDPAYYAAGAVNLAEGGGLAEPYLWNYLDDPAGLPHPGFLYWMPLSSLLAAPFAALFPGSFFALQIPFVLLSALLPLVGYGVAWQAMGSRRSAWAAGLITLFSGFFFPFWTLPETFAPFALFGSLALWLAGGGWQVASGKWWGSVMVGLLVGLAHLTRADGILLLPVVALAPLLFPQPRITDHGSRITHHVLRLALCHLSFVILGYLLPMAPWFIRNLSVVGAPLSPGGTKALWLTKYDDLYCYGCDLSLQSYLAWGWDSILSNKLSAMGVNLQRFLAENCLVFLLPLALVGFYRLRRRSPFANSLIYLLLVYLAHSLAFSYPGPRGGFFHVSSSVLPFLFAAAMEGLEAAVRWVGQWRRWNVQQAAAVFTVAAVVGAIGLSVYVADGILPKWRGIDSAYERMGRWMEQEGVGDDAIAMVNNPPAFWYYTRRQAVVVPAPVGDVETLLAAADRYGVTYVLLDRNWPLPPEGLSHPRLRQVEWGEESSRVLYEVVAR
ncbi:MAG: glycosyltransferase family 39 protein [Anaerolineae bacterium]|nr:glycosyltransferase family 39 protein [Anaerolineae bacterium]